MIERSAICSICRAALLLAGEAERVCDLWAGDKSVDALRAALSAFQDALLDEASAPKLGSGKVTERSAEL